MQKEFPEIVKREEFIDMIYNVVKTELLSDPTKFLSIFLENEKDSIDNFLNSLKLFIRSDDTYVKIYLQVKRFKEQKLITQTEFCDVTGVIGTLDLPRCGTDQDYIDWCVKYGYNATLLVFKKQRELVLKSDVNEDLKKELEETKKKLDEANKKIRVMEFSKNPCEKLKSVYNEVYKKFDKPNEIFEVMLQHINKLNFPGLTGKIENIISQEGKYKNLIDNSNSYEQLNEIKRILIKMTGNEELL
jgi:hypothetical protein